MKKRFLFGALGLLLILGGCGGGSAVTGNNENNGGGGDDEESGVDISDPSAVSFDVSNLDVSAQETSDASIAAVKMLGAVGDASVLGCEANQIADQAIMHATMIQFHACLTDAAMHKAELRGANLPRNDYGYMRVGIEAPAMPSQNSNIALVTTDDFRPLIRVGLFEQDKTLKTSVCVAGEQFHESVATKAGSRITAQVINSHSFNDQQDFTGNFEIELNLASATSTIDADTIESGHLIGMFESTFSTTAGDFDADSAGMIEFTLNDNATNTLRGGIFNSATEGSAAFHTFDAGIAGMWDATSGAAKDMAEGSHPAFPFQRTVDDEPIMVCPIFDCNFPASEDDFIALGCNGPDPDLEACFCVAVSPDGMCSYSYANNESFDISFDGDDKNFTISPDNAFTDPVAALTLPTSADVNPGDFTDPWDCQGDFIDVMLTESEIASCMVLFDDAMEEEFAGSSCYEGAGQDHIEEGEQTAS